MKTKLIFLLVGASTLLNGCRSKPAQDVQSQVSATTDETPKAAETTWEVYRGTENGGICQLSIEKDKKGKVHSMRYESNKCRDLGCKNTFTDWIDTSFIPGPSLQFPGYTRIAMSHGLRPVILEPFLLPATLVLWDEFILAKDNFSTLKAVVRSVGTFPIVPLPMQEVAWTSDCIDVKKVDVKIVDK